MKILNILIISFVISLQVLAQKNADNLYAAGYYKEAISLYKNALEKQNEAIQKLTKLKIADAYFRMNNYQESLSFYEGLYTNDVRDSIVIARLIHLKRNFCDYDGAEVYFNEYNQLITNTSTKETIKTDFFDYPRGHTDVKNIEIKLIGEKFITKGMGFTFYKDDFLIVGTSREDREDKTTFYELQKFKEVDGVEAIGDMDFKSTNYFQAYPSYDALNGYIYYTANISDRKKQNRKISDNVLQIYRVKIQGNSFSDPELLSFNEPNFNFTHPNISKDGNTLFFVSDRPGGFGGLDVYYVVKNGDEWSIPVNCGDKVNTQFNELSPFVFGDSLFFSSYGHENYGGSDVFLSIKQEGEFQKALNLGLPVNSCKDDFSYQIDSSEGLAYFISNRDSESGAVDNLFKAIIAKESFIVNDQVTGIPIESVKVIIDEDEIYLTNQEGDWVARIQEGSSFDLVFDHPNYELVEKSFESFNEVDRLWLKKVQLIPIKIQGFLVDAITNNPIDNIEIKFYERKENGNWDFYSTTNSNQEGFWSQNIRRDRPYKIEFSKQNYVDDNVMFNSFEDLGMLKNELLQKFNPYQMSVKATKDVVINIDNIYFDFDKATLREESYIVLDNLKKYLENNSTIKIELSAHTDCVGDDRYNMRLSRKRAEACKKYLLSKGIDAARITAVGYGATKPLIDCKIEKRDASAAQKNRRVEVKIL